MDLSNINLEQAAEQGAFLHLEHPVTGEKLYTEGDDPQPIGLQLVGIDSKQFRKKQREIQNRKLAKRKLHTTAELTDDESNELLAACTVGFVNVTDGELLEFSENAAHQLYKRRRWIREQVDEFVVDRRNFFTTA